MLPSLITCVHSYIIHCLPSDKGHVLEHFKALWIFENDFWLINSFFQGIIFRKPTLPNHSEDDRKAIYNGMISTLARLHNINWKGLELSDFGHRSNFLGRQVIWNSFTSLVALYYNILALPSETNFLVNFLLVFLSYFEWLW